MQYQQISIARLAHAGKKFINDGLWHQFQSDENQYYSVRGRIVRRVALTTAEDRVIFEAFKSIEPIPSRLFREGFREELSIKHKDDHYALTDILFPSFDGWEMFTDIAAGKSIMMIQKSASSLECHITLQKLDHPTLSSALLYLKAFSIAMQEAREMIRSHVTVSKQEFLLMFNTTIEAVKEFSRKQHTQRKGGMK